MRLQVWSLVQHDLMTDIPVIVELYDHSPEHMPDDIRVSLKRVKQQIIVYQADYHYQGVNTMTFMELARNRFSERHFDSRPVEEEKLQRILEAGRIAPTACNYQPQRIYVLKSPAALEKARKTKASLYSCPLVLLVCYDNETVWKNPGDRCYELYNAGEQDASIVAASMMFEAEELGVHSLWIRGFDSKTVIETFDLPANHIPVMMLALGYPGEGSHPAHLHSKRKPLDETVIWLSQQNPDDGICVELDRSEFEIT